MAEARWLHVAFKFVGPAKVSELEPIFNTALDWVRYAPNCWILWTTTDTATWYTRLKRAIGPNDTMLIIRIDPKERHGWLPKWIWERLDSKR